MTSYVRGTRFLTIPFAGIPAFWLSGEENRSKALFYLESAKRSWRVVATGISISVDYKYSFWRSRSYNQQESKKIVRDAHLR